MSLASSASSATFFHLSTPQNRLSAPEGAELQMSDGVEGLSS